jgi:asparagine synthase (glutamine-hydrolysing)
MSGIFGVVNVDGARVDRGLLEELGTFMRACGPDGSGCWSDGPAGLGHTELRTRDAGAIDRQPCTLDGRSWIVADARIDARGDLLRKLDPRARPDLRDATDAQLILHAYSAWGEDCVDHLLGDFAFAIWDARRRSLFCARDHFGVRPFFYAFDGRRLAFANVLNCVRRFPGVPDRLDNLAIGDFLLFEHIQDPDATAFAGIRRLPPAHRLALSASGLHVRRFWSLPCDATVRYRRPGEYVERFREVLGHAVGDRLTGSRVAVMMSGGLDSPSVAATALQVARRDRRTLDLRAFATVHDRLIPDEERHYSGLAAGKLGIPIEYGEADDYELYERFDEMQAYFPEPGNEPHAALTVDLARRAASHARVILTGWDGDALLSESPRPYFRALLAGGQWGRAACVAARYAAMERRIVPRAGIAPVPRSAGAASVPPFPAWLNADFVERLGLRERWAAVHSRPRMTEPLRPYAYHVLEYIARRSNFFDAFTAACTGAAAEFRHPFLDLRVIELCLSLPPFPWCHKKELLRRAMRGTLPEPVRLRPKTPLAGFPYLELLARADSRWVDEFVACAPTRRYVEQARLPPARAQRDPDEAWALLRPLGLDLWLRNLHPVNIHRQENRNEFA